jgi:hypothetical protein
VKQRNKCSLWGGPGGGDGDNRVGNSGSAGCGFEKKSQGSERTAHGT